MPDCEKGTPQISFCCPPFETSKFVKAAQAIENVIYIFEY